MPHWKEKSWFQGPSSTRWMWPDSLRQPRRRQANSVRGPLESKQPLWRRSECHRPGHQRQLTSKLMVESNWPAAFPSRQSRRKSAPINKLLVIELMNYLKINSFYLKWMNLICNDDSIAFLFRRRKPLDEDAAVVELPDSHILRVSTRGWSLNKMF